MKIKRKKKVSECMDLIIILMTIVVIVMNLIYWEHISNDISGKLLKLLPIFMVIFWYLTTREIIKEVKNE